MPHPMPEDPEATTFHREMWKPTPLLEGHKAATALGGGEQEPQLGFLEHSFSSHLALYLQSLTTDTLEVNHVRYSMVAIVNTVLYI